MLLGDYEDTACRCLEYLPMICSVTSGDRPDESKLVRGKGLEHRQQVSGNRGPEEQGNTMMLNIKC